MAESRTYNHDIKGMVQRIDRVMVEINRSQSGNVAGVIDYDLTRWKSYIEALRGYHDWIVGTPHPLDLPETHPALLTIDAAEDLDPVDNLIANDLTRLLALARGELIACQSSSLSSGLIAFDSDRFLSILTKCEAVIVLAETQTPIDLPESLPHHPSVKPGNRGPHEMPQISTT